MSMKQRAIEDKATEILSEHFLTDTLLIPIAHIARTEGIIVTERDFGNEYSGIGGFIGKDDDDTHINIGLNHNNSDEQKRVTIARLLGRYYLFKEEIEAGHREEDLSNSDIRVCPLKWGVPGSKEEDADKLGLAILLPRNPFCKVCKENKSYFSQTLVADTYCQVPISAFNYRLSMLELNWEHI